MSDCKHLIVYRVRDINIILISSIHHNMINWWWELIGNAWKLLLVVLDFLDLFLLFPG